MPAFFEMYDIVEELLLFERNKTSPLPYYRQHIKLLKDFWNNFRMWKYNGHTPREVCKELKYDT